MNSGISLLNTFQADRWFTEISGRLNAPVFRVAVVQCLTINRACQISTSSFRRNENFALDRYNILRARDGPH